MHAAANYVYADVSNKITANDDAPLTLKILVTGGEGAKLHAMYAYGGNRESATNHIIGSNLNDHIDITGDFYAHFRGANIIQTGQGDDFISINGNMSVNYYSNNTIKTDAGNDVIKFTGNITQPDSRGSNTFDTGAGNDYVHLDGKINTLTEYGTKVNGLTLNMGADYDTLVLRANGFGDFEDKYGSWLNSAGFKNASVEGIHVNFGKLENGETVDSFFAQLNDFSALKGKDISYSFTDTDNGEQTMMLDNLTKIDLGGILGMDPASETTLDKLLINLEGAKANELTIDSNDVKSIEGLKITGDGDDTIILKGDWHAGATNGDFTTYSLAEGSSVDIHNDLLTKLEILSYSYVSVA